MVRKSTTRRVRTARRSAPPVYVALGSNLGDPERNVLRGMQALQELTTKPLSCSSLWVTAPVDCPPGSPRFINAVIGLAPRRSETPESLLVKLQELEREFGRQPKKVLNEPRPLDLDLIAFGNQTRTTKTLLLPHPRAMQRRFVLGPLSEIAPDFILPGQVKTVAQLLAELPAEPLVRRVKRTGFMDGVMEFLTLFCGALILWRQ